MSDARPGADRPLVIAPRMDAGALHVEVFPNIEKLWKDPENIPSGTVGTMNWHIERCQLCAEKLVKVSGEISIET